MRREKAWENHPEKPLCFPSSQIGNLLTFETAPVCALPTMLFSYAKMHLLPKRKTAGASSATACLTFLIPMPRVMLGLRVLGVKSLVWLRQMRNPIDEVLNSIQDIISAELKRRSTPTCCTTQTELWKEPPLNNSFLQGAGFAR